MALISPETIDRIVMNLKGRVKNLVIDRDVTLVYSTLKLLHKILELDPMKRILDFELVQNLVLNLDHANTKVFNDTVDLLSQNNVLEDNNYLKVIFNVDSLARLIDLLPMLNDIPKINFCLTVIFEFTHDAKTAGTLMAKGGVNFYTALVVVSNKAYQLAEWRQENQTDHHEDHIPTVEVQLQDWSSGTLSRLEYSSPIFESQFRRSEGQRL